MEIEPVSMEDLSERSGLAKARDEFIGALMRAAHAYVRDARSALGAPIQAPPAPAVRVPKVPAGLQPAKKAHRHALKYTQGFMQHGPREMSALVGLLANTIRAPLRGADKRAEQMRKAVRALAREGFLRIDGVFVHPVIQAVMPRGVGQKFVLERARPMLIRGPMHIQELVAAIAAGRPMVEGEKRDRRLYLTSREVNALIEQGFLFMKDELVSHQEFPKAEVTPDEFAKQIEQGM